MTNIPELTDDEATVMRFLTISQTDRFTAAVPKIDSIADDDDVSLAALAAYDAKKRAAIRVEAMTTHFRIRPFAEWHEEDGAVLWFTLPIQEPPWCGTPNDDDWPWVWTKKEDTCWCLLPSFFIDDDAAKFLSKEPTNG